MDSQKPTLKQRVRLVTGNIATIACLVMYFSYIGQIMSNFSGHPVSPVQPLCAAVNATLWVIYGWVKPDKKDWPVIIANFPGIIFGLVTGITAIF
ncbi:MAG: SemiSWEET family transporter [Limosilactobacillus sp.]|uniref:SemiSWEET family transporter n=1 Tax=Limosilactobacillus sp. TaxID=2773925 RepID=UPI0027037FBE|nr:SemiSWEET family transporter [Limosilactobacillus sp.]